MLCHGCPRQAIVAAYGLDERTVADWQQLSRRCHVQADELWVKVLGRRLWLAMALAVPSRLWLGGVLSRCRDGRLIAAVVALVRSCARSLAMLIGQLVKRYRGWRGRGGAGKGGCRRWRRG
jgi:hypothetical protein